MRILGIDPGSIVAGFGCIESKREVPIRTEDFRVVGAGAIKFDRLQPHSTRIAKLYREIISVIEEFDPDVCVIEKAFCGANQSSALKLGEARGALIAAIAMQKVSLEEVTPAQVKRTITGSGRASKEDVSFALKILLKFERGKLPYDVSDAVAIALSFGINSLGRTMQRSSTRAREKTL